MSVLQEVIPTKKGTRMTANEKQRNFKVSIRVLNPVFREGDETEKTFVGSGYILFITSANGVTSMAHGYNCSKDIACGMATVMDMAGALPLLLQQTMQRLIDNGEEVIATAVMAQIAAILSGGNEKKEEG